MGRLDLCNAYEGRDDAPPSVVVGAPPLIVESGAPGARDEVKAYADRITAAWQSFFDVDVHPWAIGVGLVGATGLPKEIEDEWGEQLAGFVAVDPSTNSPAPTKKTKKDQALYFAKVRADRLAFDSYRGDILSFDLSGPGPSQAWQRLQLFEKTLHADRAAFQATTGIAPKSDVPEQLEEPGGVKREGYMGKIVLAVGILAGAWALSSVARVVGR
jgi:hypothetical protein